MLTMKLKVMGDDWHFTLLRGRSYERRFADSEAITDLSQRHVFFNKDHFTVSTILHELTHVFMTYTCVQRTEKADIDVLEEVFCEAVPLYGHRIYDTAFILVKKWDKHVKKKTELSEIDNYRFIKRLGAKR